MNIKQAKLAVNAHKHNLLNSFCNNGYVYVKQHENNKQKSGKNRDRESALMSGRHSMATRPDLSRTALNINEFTLFDMFGPPCRRAVIFSRFAGSLNMVF